MIIRKKDVAAVVALCWDVACNTPMENVSPGIYNGYDQAGNPQMNLIRWTTYQLLLSNLLPKESRATLHQEETKEPWDE